MCLKLVVFVAIVTVNLANGALLLWSKSKFEISPLKSFADEDFGALLQEMGNPETAIYKSISPSLSPKFKEILEGFHSGYNPNGEINTENATEISGEDEEDFVKIKQNLELFLNTLSVIVLPTDNTRYKRETVLSTTTEAPVNPPKGPVLYKGKSKKDDTFTLMYSSQPLLLRVNNSNAYYIGGTSPDMITVDTISRDSFSRLNVNIPVEDGVKVTLRFMFALLTSGYWMLTSVKISDNVNNLSFSLNISDQEVLAPNHFSYHCNGETIFSDSINNVELYLYDIQVQVGSKNGIFSDAYDCVNFTTAPIWSGLLVAAILGLGLNIALYAINDIKTMDKFDNQKTKQLAITVAE